MKLMNLKSFLAAAERLILRFWYVLPLLFALFWFAWMWWLYYENVPILRDIVVILHLFTTIVLLVSWGVLLANKKWWKFIVSFVATLVIVFIFLFPFIIAFSIFT